MTAAEPLDPERLAAIKARDAAPYDALTLREAREDRRALLLEIERLQARRADIWDEGHQSASDAECGYINPTEDVNPYRTPLPSPCHDGHHDPMCAVLVRNGDCDQGRGA